MQGYRVYTRTKMQARSAMVHQLAAKSLRLHIKSTDGANFCWRSEFCIRKMCFSPDVKAIKSPFKILAHWNQLYLISL